jgi:hypothetical protein
MTPDGVEDFKETYEEDLRRGEGGQAILVSRRE